MAVDKIYFYILTRTGSGGIDPEPNDSFESIEEGDDYDNFDEDDIDNDI